MSIVSITNIAIENNPANCLSPITLNLTFECIKPIPEQIDWELVYIGSAKDDQYDQVLDQFSMGPLEQGIMSFTLESNPPDFTQIPSKYDILGVTALILKVSYRKQEFVRVGYYVINQYTDPQLIEQDPEVVPLEKVQRKILHDKPRITHFNIKWDDSQEIVNNANLQETKNEDGLSTVVQDEKELLNRENYLDQFKLDQKNINQFTEKKGASEIASNNPFENNLNKFADLDSTATKDFFRKPDSSVFFS